MQPGGQGGWNQVAGTQTGPDGSYDLGGLPAGSYRIQFQDFSGGYVTQWYNNKSDFNSANPVAVTAGSPTPDINATLALAGFEVLGLQTFLTAGPKEARAWTIRRGAGAPEAAGVIHTDFQRGFIKAEVVSYDELIAAGSLPAARAAGKVRMEGKEYAMRDGDVVEFRFNV